MKREKPLGANGESLPKCQFFVVVELTCSQIKLGGLLREFPVYSENEA